MCRQKICIINNYLTLCHQTNGERERKTTKTTFEVKWVALLSFKGRFFIDPRSLTSIHPRLARSLACLLISWTNPNSTRCVVVPHSLKLYIVVSVRLLLSGWGRQQLDVGWLIRANKFYVKLLVNWLIFGTGESWYRRTTRLIPSN